MSPRAFLPASAITTQRLERAFGHVLTGWCSDWFGRGHASLRQTSARHGRSVVPGGAIHTSKHESPGIELSALGKRRLIEAALSSDLEGVQQSDADRAILGGLADEIASDLDERLRAVLGGEESAPLSTLELVLDGQAIGTLAVSARALAEVLRRTVKTRNTPTAFAASRLEAATLTPITIDAVLGSAGVSLKDLADLSVGDVIVLDAGLDTAAAVRIAGTHQVIAVGRLASHPSHNALTIAPMAKERKRYDQG